MVSWGHPQASTPTGGLLETSGIYQGPAHEVGRLLRVYVGIVKKFRTVAGGSGRWAYGALQSGLLRGLSLRLFSCGIKQDPSPLRSNKFKL